MDKVAGGRRDVEEWYEPRLVELGDHQAWHQTPCGMDGSSRG